MKRLLLLLPLTLASCGLFGTPKNYDVTGTLSGTAPAGTVKLAVVGVGLTGVVNADVPQIAVALPSTQKFALDYPNVADGIYQVIAYVDANGDGKYNVGETRTQNNGKYLIYSTNGVLSGLTNVKAGWNYAVGLNVTQPGRVTDYDLTW